tara:strand:- start:1236 stop:1682 length:447 start_codon:yes stop_codon:yes gene_type:complete
MRSDALNKNSNKFALENDNGVFKYTSYSATITVADGATTGKESAIAMPDNFVPMAVALTVLTASTNAVNFVDVGSDADTDGYVDGASIAVNSAGYKGIIPCNGVLAMGNPTAGAVIGTPDEVECVISGDPGSDTVLRFDIIGFECSLG